MENETENPNPSEIAERIQARIVAKIDEMAKEISSEFGLGQETLSILAGVLIQNEGEGNYGAYMATSCTPELAAVLVQFLAREVKIAWHRQVLENLLASKSGPIGPLN